MQSLLETLPAAVYTCAVDGTIQAYNQRAAELWGRKPALRSPSERFCGSLRMFRVDGALLPHEQCPMADVLRTGQAVFDQEVIVERPGGARCIALVNIAPLRDQDGKLIGAINCFQDITGRKTAERALGEHVEKQAALFEFTDGLFRAGDLGEIYEAALSAVIRALRCHRAAILLFDDAGVMKFCAWRGISDAYRNAVEGHSPWTPDTVDPPAICIGSIDNADLDDSLKAVITSEGIGAVAFVPVVVNGKLAGKFMAYYNHAHSFSDSDTAVAVTISRQLGFALARLQEEQARQRAEQSARLLTAIVETSDDAIISKDLNGTITSWNKGAERLFGYAPDEILGRPVTALIPQERHEEAPEILARISRGERITPYETVRVRKDGSLVDVSLTVSPVLDSRGRVVGASKIARDITDRKQGQERQELLTRELQHRTRNLFAVLHAVVSRSFEGRTSLEDAKTAVLSRLHALSQTHDMLIERDWQGADLGDIVRLEMASYENRVTVSGPRIPLNPKAAQNFGLALHELATNAMKHGALSSPQGHIDITWSIFTADGAEAFRFRWQERGGPPVLPPKRKGFGTTVLEYVMRDICSDQPRVGYNPAGCSYELIGSVAAIAAEGFTGTPD